MITRLGTDFYETICKCAMADSHCRKLTMDKANAIYQTIVMALALPEGAKVLEYLSEPCISCIFELCITSIKKYRTIILVRTTRLPGE